MIYLLAGASLVILGWTVRGAWDRHYQVRCSCGSAWNVTTNAEQTLTEFFENHDGPGHEVA